MAPFFVFIGIILALFAFFIVDFYISLQNEKAYAKTYQKRIDDIKVGDIYEWNTDRDPPQRNPFKEPDEYNPVIVIVDKKINQFGEVWVQYYHGPNGSGDVKWEQSAADLIKYYRKRKGE